MAKKQRRDYGSGSVYQAHHEKHGCPDPAPGDNGKLARADHRCKAPWVGAATRGWTTTGARRRITVKAPTEQEAKRRLRQRLNEIDSGRIGKVSASTTVKSWADTWLPISERVAAPTTYNNTATAIRRWIVPTIGSLRLADLEPADIRAVATAQRKAGRSSSTQRRTHSVLNQLLKAALEEGHAVPSRVIDIQAPAIAVSDRDALTVEQAVAVLEVAAARDDAARWLAALLQGIRQAEALGLTRDAVDLAAGTITISWQLKPLQYRRPRDRSSGFRVPDGYEHRQIRDRWHLVRPKSKAGWRVIPMVPWMESAMRQRLETAPPAPHGLIWHTEVGDPTKLDDAAWYELQARAGVTHPERLTRAGGPAPFTVHEARHSTATLLLEAGADPAAIIAIMGHSSVLTSRGYMHANSDLLRGALEAVADRLALPGP